MVTWGAEESAAVVAAAVVAGAGAEPASVVAAPVPVSPRIALTAAPTADPAALISDDSGSAAKTTGEIADAVFEVELTAGACLAMRGTSATACAANSSAALKSVLTMVSMYIS